MKRETIFSPCRKWRYTLWREFGKDDLFETTAAAVPCAYVQFIGLNPSTADEVQDDPTIRRCINFSKAWGYGAYCMTNIFAWRDTNPAKMKAAVEPIGADNDKWLSEIAKNAGMIICAWGTHGEFNDRGEDVMRLLQPYQSKVFCLGENSDGSPKHPLYIAANTQPKTFQVVF